MANKLPTFDRLINPLLRALEALGGSGAVDEIYEKVIELGSSPRTSWPNCTTRTGAIRPRSAIGWHGRAPI